jgi:spore coat protein CotH
VYNYYFYFFFSSFLFMLLRWDVRAYEESYAYRGGNIWSVNSGFPGGGVREGEAKVRIT